MMLLYIVLCLLLLAGIPVLFLLCVERLVENDQK